MTKLYFPNLNGLRFLAALGVVIHHVEQFKAEQGLPSGWGESFVKLLGKGGVYLFFVLSGFLITYLLLEEKNKTGTISVRHFYLRRILRTWPLYFLVIFLSLWVWPRVFPPIVAGDSSSLFLTSGSGMLCLLLLSPHFALCFMKPLAFAGQTWSIGIEEHFYLVWPVLMKSIGNKVWLILSIAAGYPLFFHFYFNWLAAQPKETIEMMSYFTKFLVMFRVDCMALGGLAAWVVHTSHPLLRYLRNPAAYLLSVGICVWMFARQDRPFMHYTLWFSLCFAVILLNIIVDHRTARILESAVPSYLGRISYGIYMWHPVAIATVFLAVGRPSISPWVHYPLILILTVGISSLSYHFYENFFIRKKLRYAKVESTDAQNA